MRSHFGSSQNGGHKEHRLVVWVCDQQKHVALGTFCRVHIRRFAHTHTDAGRETDTGRDTDTYTDKDKDTDTGTGTGTGTSTGTYTIMCAPVS